MSIQFASSHSIDFFKLAGTVNTASIPAAFDANYVKQTLRCPSASPCWRHTLPSAVQSDFYYQCKMYQTSSATAGVPMLHFQSSVATVLTGRLRLYYVSNGIMAFQWNNAGTWTTLGSTLALANNTLYTFTFRFKFHASAGDLAWYVNNAVQAQVTGNTSTYGTFISDVDYANPSPGSGATGDTDFAEIFVTTNENPYAFKVKTHVLNGAGTTSAWTGAYTDVDEADPSTTDIISSATANQVSTFATDDLPAIGADVIRAIQVSVMARRGSTGPQNIQTVLRASATDQVGSTQLLTTGYNTYRQIYETNSVTGAEFTKAEIDASEVGVKSIT